jgi:gamma-glutamylcyclotransferase (GGCT)/AIG2-like uncharacterized protein YtfP
MSESQVWWKDEAPRFLTGVLAHINQSRRRHESVDRCEDLFKALNKTWNAHFTYRKRKGSLTDTEVAKGRSDSQAFAQLLIAGLDGEDTKRLCESESVGALAAFSPQVMNHDTLIRRDYDPRHVTEELRNEACDEHKQLLSALGRYSQDPNGNNSRTALLKKIQQLLYVVRSNIAHSEKTARGPDRAKSKRDEEVSNLASRVVEDFFDLLFEQPSRRLAVYGTLAPGEVNETVLGSVVGDWEDGVVKGELTTKMGLARLRWDEGAPDVRVKVLTSVDLPQNYPAIDRFEGKSYTRILIPVAFGGSMMICNLYEIA